MALREFVKLVFEKGPSKAGDPGLYFDILSAELSPAQVAANTTAEEEFTVTGAALGDMVLWVEKPTHQAGLGVLGGRVSAADKVKIRFGNPTAAGITPTASETYKFAIVRLVK